jgi:hypothetical protein
VSVNVTASSSTITATATGTAVEAGVSSSTVSASSSGGIGPQGPQGPQGPAGEGVDVEWDDILNKPATFPPDTTSLATVAVSGSYEDLLDQPTIPAEYILPAANATTLGGVIFGTGLSFFANGSVSVAYGVTSSTACRGDDSRLSNARTPTSHVHGNITNAGAIGSTTGQIVVTTTAGVLTTAASISTSQVSGLATVATSGSASDLGAGTLPAARLPTHTHAIADVTNLQTALDGKQESGSYASATHAHAASDVTSGTLDIARIPTGSTSSTVCIGNDARLSDARTPSAHTHPLSDLSQSGATTNQVPQWNGTAWVPATVSGGGGSATTNAADLTSGTLNDARLSFVPLHPFLLMGG